MPAHSCAKRPGSGSERTQRKPTKSSDAVATTVPRTASGPLLDPPKKPPPRTSAPGPASVVLAPARHIRSSLTRPQPGHAVESGTQSETHSARLPTMSKAPRADTQLLHAPVSDAAPRAVLQSVVPLSAPGSGDPFAPTCHSAFVGSRLPEL